MKLSRLIVGAVLSLAALIAACGDDDTTKPGDVTSPAPINDLAIIDSGDSTLTLHWTATGDDGRTGIAERYQLRRSSSPITAANFGSAIVVLDPPSPTAAGTIQTFWVAGVDTTQVTHFAIKAVDEAGNVSQISNDAAWLPGNAPQHFVVDIPPFKDNSMYEESDTLSNGALPYVFTGRTEGLSGTALLRRALVAFAISDSIPAGAVIDSVQLTMRVSKVRTSASRATAIHRATALWGEGNSDSGGAGGGGAPAATNDATWGYRFFKTVSWTTPGGDFSAIASATTNLAGLGFYTWKSAQMKADVQSWLDTPANNFGWVVTGDESGTVGTAKRLDSRENPTSANVPVLKVFYTVQ
ncbi:MAG TPA: DNRLRE domain-containing protein [Candidatus Krumholzibacteria bacterium]|nr:DNRLRE domain-containing protein [Candidatus Krumholzibacteria bacterium]